MKIYFVTHNKGKLREFKEILGEDNVEQIDFDYDEIRSSDPVEIAKDGAKFCANKYNKPIVVEDSGLFISELNNFPGTYSATIHKQIGLKGILKVMKDVTDRTCFYKSAIGFCEPGKEPQGFLGEEEGTIAEEERGTNGFGHDPIFIPKGSDKTYGEMEDVEKVKKFRRRAIEKFLEYYKNI
ncbi:RdgB/HAM1 family non-canonical purine NTP pyrophosphatase [Nanoarchaeota archaeon]